MARRGSRVHWQLERCRRVEERALKRVLFSSEEPSRRGIQATGILLSDEELRELEGVASAQAALRWARKAARK